MKKLLALVIVFHCIGCKGSTYDERNANLDTTYKIVFDSTLVSTYRIVDNDFSQAKAMDKRLSYYSTEELKSLPECIRETLAIVVPYDISKVSLINTLKYITYKKTKSDNDIDEIIIFAYDDERDLNAISGYTFGKLFWGPKGKLGNMTSRIAKENIRDNYQFEIDIKEKVGTIKPTEIPTDRELEIYYTMMDEKYMDWEEEKLFKMLMEKFDLKTEEEIQAIWLKVADYKN